MLFSSHILEEVEQVARQIEVVVAGRHAASGDFGAIRRLMTDRPNRFVLRTADDRKMASVLMADPSVRGARAAGRGRDRAGGIRLRAVQRGAPRLAREHGVRLHEVTPTDESLESVFSLPGVVMRAGLADDRAAGREEHLRALARGPCCSCSHWCSSGSRSSPGRSSASPGGPQHTLYGLGLVVVVPLVALLATSGLLAPEIDDGSISTCSRSPCRARRSSSASWSWRWRACWRSRRCRCCWPGWCCAPTTRPSRSASRSGRCWAARRTALFALLSVVTRHAVVVGLVYLLVWEGLLGGLLDGVRWLSITRWSAEVADRVAGLTLVAQLPLTYALAAGVVVIVGGTWLTGRRLRAFNLTGDE